MRPSVRDVFYDFTARFEGVVPWLYADVLGLVTVGVGNLVDPMSTALVLPFLRQNGEPATRGQIADEWQRVKNDPKCASLGHRYAERITSLRLTTEGVTDLVLGKLEANDHALARRFASWEEWPADAQLATHSMAWACGPAFHFPRLEGALMARAFAAAAEEAHIRTDNNPGVVPRNTANRLLYKNAAAVVSQSLDPAALYWPRDLSAPLGDADTDPPPDDVA